MPKINNFNSKVTEAMTKICETLRKYKVMNFSHDITFGDGKIVMLSLDNQVLSQYVKYELAPVCTGSEGRVLTEGAYVNDFLTDNYSDCAQLFPKLFQLFKFKNTYSMVEKEGDCQHFYTFTFNMNTNDYIHYLINNIHFFNNFIYYYKISAKDLIKEAKQPKNHIILPYSSNLKGSQHSLKTVKNIVCELDKNRVQLIHKNTKKLIKLSVQQSKCFNLIIEGYSIKEIARRLELSPRTTENYITNIRKILNCNSVKELILKYVSQFTNCN